MQDLTKNTIKTKTSCFEQEINHIPTQKYQMNNEANVMQKHPSHVLHWRIVVKNQLQ